MKTYQEVIDLLNTYRETELDIEDVIEFIEFQQNVNIEQEDTIQALQDTLMQIEYLAARQR